MGSPHERQRQLLVLRPGNQDGHSADPQGHQVKGTGRWKSSLEAGAARRRWQCCEYTVWVWEFYITFST